MAELMDAVIRHDVGRVKELVGVAGRRVCPNFVDTETGDTPIMVAVRKGYTPIVRILASYIYTDLEHRNYVGISALVIAVYLRRYRCARILLRRGVDVNTCDDEGISLIYYIIAKGLVSFMRLFIQYGVDVNVSYSKYDRPLVHAICWNKMAMVKMLLRHPSIDLNIDWSRRLGVSILKRELRDRMYHIVEQLIATYEGERGKEG